MGNYNLKKFFLSLLLCAIMASFQESSSAEEINPEKMNFELGVSCLQQKDYIQAIKYFGLVVLKNPKNVEAHYNLGLAYKKAGMDAKSVLEYDKVVKLLNNPDSKTIDVNKLRQENRILHDNELASDKYKLYSNVKSQENDYIDLGDVHYDNQQFETAIEYYNLALQINPYNDYTYYKVAQSYIDAGNYIQAEPYISKAVELRPENPKYKYYKDIVVKNIGTKYTKNVDLREKVLNQALNRKDPMQGFDIPEEYKKQLFSEDEKASSNDNTPEPFVEKTAVAPTTAKVEKKEPVTKKIKLIFGKKQKLKTDSSAIVNEKAPEAKDETQGELTQGKSQELDYLDLADLHYDNQEYDTAIEYYNLALNINLNNDYTYYKIARCYLEMKKYRDADEFMTKALALSPQNKKYVYFRNEIIANLSSQPTQALASKTPEYYPKNNDTHLAPNLKMIAQDPNLDNEDLEIEPDVSNAKTPTLTIKKEQTQKPKQNKVKESPVQQIASTEDTTPSIFGKDMRYYQTTEPEHKTPETQTPDYQPDKPIQEQPKEPQFTPDYYNDKGVEYFKKDNLQKAENFFKKAIELKPMYAKAYNNLANVEQKRGNLDQAIAYDLQAIQIDPTYPEAYYNMALIYKQKKDFTNEISYLDQTIQADPKFYQAYFTRGLAHYTAGNYEQAKYNFKETLKLKNDHYLASQNLGIIYANELNKDEAETYLKTAIRLNKNNPTSYYYLAAIYQNAGQVFDAMDNYKKSIDLDPTNYKAYLALSKCYEQNDEIDRAIDTLRDAVQLGPSNAEPYNMMGLLYLKKDKYVEATQSFQKAVEINPKRSVYHYNLSQSYICLNMKTRAKGEFEKATSIDPATIQDYIDLSEIFYDRSMPSYSIKVLKDGIAALPDNDYLYVALAGFYEKTGAIESAKKTLSDYLVKKPNGTLSLLIQRKLSAMGNTQAAAGNDDN